MRALARVFRAKFLKGLRRAFEPGKLGEDASVRLARNVGLAEGGVE